MWLVPRQRWPVCPPSKHREKLETLDFRPPKICYLLASTVAKRENRFFKIIAGFSNNAVFSNDAEISTPLLGFIATSVAATNKVWLEGTTRFIADYVLESNEELLRANYKRTKNVTRILNAIKGDIKINMEKMQSLEIIENWDESTLTVVKDPMDAYGALIDYEFDVVTPLYTITINQHMKI